MIICNIIILWHSMIVIYNNFIANKLECTVILTFAFRDTEKMFSQIFNTVKF